MAHLEQEEPLQAWSRVHAALVLCGAIAVAVLDNPWPISALATLSFAAFMYSGRRTFTPQGQFGVANWVTAFRLVVTLGLGVLFHEAGGVLLGAILLGILVLDGVDGWLARRMASTSAFGARFDMETDALLVLVIELELWQRGRLGVWILVTGLLRYVYVLAVAVLPRFSREMPRSRLGHYAFAVLLVGLSAALMLPGQAGTLAAAIGTGAVVYSFLYSFYGSYTRSSSEAFGI